MTAGAPGGYRSERRRVWSSRPSSGAAAQSCASVCQTDENNPPA